MRTFQLPAVLLAVACAACASAESKPLDHQPPPATPQSDTTVRVSPASRPYVVTQRISLGDSIPVVRAPARIAFREGAVSQVGMPVAGRITEVHVKSGDRVHAGDPLVTLTSSDAAAARASAAAAIAEHDAAVKEVARQEAMRASGVGIDSERVAAESRRRQSEVELARAQTSAALLGAGGGSVVVLRAPIDGTVITRRATVGAVAQPGGEPLIEIGNPSALWVIADVFERDLPQVEDGAAVDVELSTHSAPVHGHVASVGSALTGTTRTAPVYISLDQATADVRAGMFARAAIEAPAGRSIVLPSEAVLLEDGKTYLVYVQTIDADVYAARKVAVGPSIDGMVQILSGLTVGDQVVVKGALLLDGAADQLL